MNWILENWDKILMALGAIYAAATTIAAITPSDRDNTWIEKIGKLADRIGLNIKGK